MIDAFWSKVDKSGECWLWTGYRQRAGYGQIGRSGTTHRRAWELTNGPIPDGLWVLHRCDNPPCVRPEHLFLGTGADNNADMHAKGRSSGGKTLTTEQAQEVRRRYSAGETGMAIAADMGLLWRNVYNILSGVTWAWLGPALLVKRKRVRELP